MKEKQKMSTEDVFLMWKGETKELGKSRYTAKERTEILDELAEQLFRFGIDLDDAKMLKRKVVDFLVTKEGMKDSGKHKGWKLATEEDFISSLLVHYESQMEVVNDTTNKKMVRKMEFYGGADYMERQPLIVAWSKHKFKDQWTEAMCLETHKIGGPLQKMFQKEVFLSEWAKGKEERPQWAKGI